MEPPYQGSFLRQIRERPPAEPEPAVQMCACFAAPSTRRARVAASFHDLTVVNISPEAAALESPNRLFASRTLPRFGLAPVFGRKWRPLTRKLFSRKPK